MTSCPTAQTIDFGGLSIAFDAEVLRPRPWTAGQSRWAADLLADLPEGPVLELCAGAGHIGLLAVHETERRLVCVDANPVAAAYAAQNAVAAGMEARVEVREGLMAEVLGDDERFVLVVADPPYLPSRDTRQFPEDPLLAVDGGDDGLDVVRECLRVIERHLDPGGIALLQVRDRGQAQAAADLAQGSLLHPTEVKVYAGQGAVLRLDRS